MGKGNVGGNKYDYTPDKLSANEAMGVKLGQTQYQFNTPAGLYTLATLGMGPGSREMMAQDVSSQYDTQKQLRRAKPGYEQEARAQGAMARQQAIAGGLGGGGVQSSADVQAYNGVMAQYAALRQALEMARVQQQMQMYGGIAQAAGAFYTGGASAAPTGAGTGAAAATGSNMMLGGMGY